MQGAVAASSALFLTRVSRLTHALEAPAPAGFLTDAELRVVEALTARLLPTDETPGAREAGVANYIQALLSVFPGADPNGDAQTTAADVTAVIRALGMDDPAADVDGNGVVDAADVALTRSSIFGTVLVGAPTFGGHPLFAGGPFSGRTPFPDPATGTPSTNFPPNAFLTALPLPRVKRLAWTVRLLGADAVPEVADNPLATTLPDVDMRRRYREGVAEVNALSMSQFGAPYDELDTEQQDTILKTVRQQSRDFYDLLINHTIEGLLCAPEYGGNRIGDDGQPVGWKLTHFDGDSQPLGYTIFDETINDYRERQDKPNSTINPDDDCSGVSSDMLAYLNLVLVRLAQATRFPDPFCDSGLPE